MDETNLYPPKIFIRVIKPFVLWRRIPYHPLLDDVKLHHSAKHTFLRQNNKTYHKGKSPFTRWPKKSPSFTRAAFDWICTPHMFKFLPRQPINIIFIQLSTPLDGAVLDTMLLDVTPLTPHPSTYSFNNHSDVADMFSGNYSAGTGHLLTLCLLQRGKSPGLHLPPHPHPPTRIF